MKESAPASSNLRLRILTAVVAVPVVLAALYFSEYGYGIIFSGISLLCLNEFYTLVTKNGANPSHRRGMVLGALLLAFTFCVGALQLPAKFMVLVLPQIALVFIDKLYRPSAKPIEDMAYTFLGLVYTVLPFAMLHIATFRSGDYSYQIPMGILLLLWASDTGAYFAGRAFGRRKLFERHSPKKTWEGFTGGFVAAGGVAAALAYGFTDLKPLLWVLIMVFIVVAGTLGDLVESMFKRSMHIKDSGAALPGHGGFLDRFDGLLIALPFVCTLLILLS
jgi:phosphatidate cytidylyltransferase